MAFDWISCISIFNLKFFFFSMLTCSVHHNTRQSSIHVSDVLIWHQQVYLHLAAVLVRSFGQTRLVRSFGQTRFTSRSSQLRSSPLQFLHGLPWYCRRADELKIEPVKENTVCKNNWCWAATYWLLGGRNPPSKAAACHVSRYKKMVFFVVVLP